MVKSPEKSEILTLSSQNLADIMDAVVERGISFRFRAHGDSMKPAIRDGDVITISPPEEGEPRVGQVAACRMPGIGNLLVHRVIRRRGGEVLIRSDRLRQPDGWVPREQLLGIVTAVERNGRPVFWPWKGVAARLAFVMLTKIRLGNLLRSLYRRGVGNIFGKTDGGR